MIIIIIITIVIFVIIVSLLAVASTRKEFFNEEINSYRLGDSLGLGFVGGSTDKYKPNELAMQISETYPNSIIGYMVNNKEKGDIYKLLKDAVGNVSCKKPPNDVFVIHLRLGDKFQKIDSNSPYYDLPSVEDYEKLVPYMKRKGIDKVVLVGGLGNFHPTQDKFKTMSYKYQEKLTTMLRNKGVEVEIKKSGSADEDFCYLVKADNLVLGSGRFASTAAWVNDGNIYSFNEVKLKQLKKDAPRGEGNLILVE